VNLLRIKLGHYQKAEEVASLLRMDAVELALMLKDHPEEFWRRVEQTPGVSEYLSRKVRETLN
jgi:hypothetical protein